jgi:hypothetical protein
VPREVIIINIYSIMPLTVLVMKVNYFVNAKSESERRLE